VGEGWEFGIGGEAEGDELGDGELVEVSAFSGGEEHGEAKALFDPDDAVLIFESIAAGALDYEEEDDGHDDLPEMGVPVGRPVVDGDVDREGDVEEKQRDEDEVEERVEAYVVLEGLWCGHGGVLFTGPQHSILGVGESGGVGCEGCPAGRAPCAAAVTS
jgi:hypothetical protein